MPVYYICRKCRAVLYVYKPSRRDTGLPSPSEILEIYNIKKCPGCGRNLGPSNITRILPSAGVKD